MSNLKTLTIFTIATVLAAPAFAQEADPDAMFDPSPESVAVDFMSSDLDENGSLNADEFVTFAAMRADDGEESFKDLVVGGEYRAAFAAYDTDASGSLESAELSVQGAPKSDPEVSEKEEDSVITPETEF